VHGSPSLGKNRKGPFKSSKKGQKMSKRGQKLEKGIKISKQLKNTLKIDQKQVITSF